jgi:aminobenzoyl-glutamate utilization protein B
MATPIAHNGCVAGAKATALTLIDLFTNPTILAQAKEYFTNVQTKNQHYIPFISAKDPPPIYLNREIMEKHREQMKPFYYDPSKYGTYLEQLSIKYPTLTPQ